MMRINDIEFRQMGGGRNAEIICWNNFNNSDAPFEEYCYTLMWFRKDKEGYFIEFIGDRPLKYHNTEVLWRLMKYGQTVLTARMALLDET